MIIDSNQHFWKFDLDRDTRIDTSMKVIKKNFLLNDLKPVLKKNGVDGCMAVQAKKDDCLLRSYAQRSIGKLSKHNLTYDILVFSQQLPAMLALIKKFTKQQFILDHIAKPNISEPMSNQWKVNITAFSKFENVSCKLSGMVTEAKKIIYKEQIFTPFLDRGFTSFEPNRLLFSSDWHDCLLGVDYKKVFSIIKNYLNKYSKEKKAQVLGSNAIKICNL